MNASSGVVLKTEEMGREGVVSTPVKVVVAVEAKE
jgi:hypothetical protein